MLGSAPMLYDKIASLPAEISDEIRQIMPPQSFIGTSRANYAAYHSLCLSDYSDRKMRRHIDKCVRRDCHFVLNQILNECMARFISTENFWCNNSVYKNYAYYILQLCIEHEAEHCCVVVKQHLAKHGVHKCRHWFVTPGCNMAVSWFGNDDPSDAEADETDNVNDVDNVENEVNI